LCPAGLQATDARTIEATTEFFAIFSDIKRSYLIEVQMIKYVSGDILRANSEYIAHGVATGSQQGADTVLCFSDFEKIPPRFKNISGNSPVETSFRVAICL